MPMKKIFKRSAKVALTASIAAASLLSVAASASEVNVYTDRQEFLIAPLLEAYTEATGTKVNVVYASGGMEERIKAEGRNSPVDVVLTVDVGRLVDMVNEGLTQSVTSPTLEANIPAEFRAEDGSWYGLTFRARPVFASKERVDASEINSYLDLADPQWKGRICTRPGDHDYNLGLLAAMIYHHGEETAREWIQGVKANLARAPQGNDRGQVKNVYDGLCDLAIVNTYYMGAMLASDEQRPWAESVNLLFVDQDTVGTHINMSGAVVARHAPNLDQAVELLEFLSDDVAQQMYAAGNTEYPVKEGVERSDIVKMWGEPKFDAESPGAIAEYKGLALRIMNEIDYNAGP